MNMQWDFNMSLVFGLLSDVLDLMVLCSCWANAVVPLSVFDVVVCSS